MTKDEFDKAIAEIELEAKEKKQVVYIDYAVKNKTNSIGDIISDHSCTILIDKLNVKFNLLSKYPEMVYYGKKLRKDNTPYKNGDREVIWQSNIKIK